MILAIVGLAAFGGLWIWLFWSDARSVWAQSFEVEPVQYYAIRPGPLHPAMDGLRPLPPTEDQFFDWGARDDCLYLMDNAKGDPDGS